MPRQAAPSCDALRAAAAISAIGVRRGFWPGAAHMADCAHHLQSSLQLPILPGTILQKLTVLPNLPVRILFAQYKRSWAQRRLASARPKRSRRLRRPPPSARRPNFAIRLFTRAYVPDLLLAERLSQFDAVDKVDRASLQVELVDVHPL